MSYPGDSVGTGSRNTYTDANAIISVDGTSADGVSFSVTTDTEQWDGSFAPTLGARLHQGWFRDAHRVQDATHPRLEVTGDGRGCNEDFGGFVIRSIQFDTDGQVVELSLSFLQHCESATAPPLTGWFTYNAPSPAPVTLISQDPAVVPGEPITLSVTVAPTRPAPTGSVRFVDGETTLGHVDVDSLGLARLTTSLRPGTHSIRADYSGDVNHSARSSNTITQVVSTAHTYFWFADSGEWVGMGAMANYASPWATVNFNGSSSFIDVWTSSPYWGVLLGPPTGQTFRVGWTYSIAGLADATHAELSFGGDGRGCNNTYGSLVIHRLKTDSSGQVTELIADFTQRCEFPNAAPAYGHLVLNLN